MTPNIIKSELIKAGIKQADIARELGIKRPSVNGVINQHQTNYRVMDLIAQKLNQDPRVFWGPRYRKAA